MRYLIIPLLIAGVTFPSIGDQLAKLLANDGAAGDHFGVSVAISGTAGNEIAIVGAYLHDDNGTDSGSAYIFDISDPANPVQITKLLPDDGAAGDHFGRFVALSGDTVVVGARYDDGNGTDSGSAYVFVRVDGVWMQQAKLLPDDGQADDYFSNAVAVSGDTALVGAYGDDDNGDLSGSAYVFTREADGVWTQQAKFLPDDGAAGDWFGVNVAISGSTALVGSWIDDNNGTNSGSAYLFDISDPANPVQIAKLLPDDGAAGDQFGVSSANRRVRWYCANSIEELGHRYVHSNFSICDWYQ